MNVIRSALAVAALAFPLAARAADEAPPEPETELAWIAQPSPLGLVKVAAGVPLRDRAVRVAFEPATEGAIGRVCLVFDAAFCDKYVRYAPFMDLRLPQYDGRYGLAVFVEPGGGGQASMLRFLVVVDRTAPTVSDLAAKRTAEGVAVSWSAGEPGKHDGQVTHFVRWTSADQVPACAGSGEIAWEGPGTSAVLAGVPEDQQVRLVACAVDAAGNVGSTAIVDVAERDATPPVITAVRVAGDAQLVAGRDVPLQITATDESPIARWCHTSRTEPVCEWQPFGPKVIARAATDRGEAVLFVRVVDALGNESEPFEVVLDVDAAPPAIAGFTAQGGPDGLVATWESLVDPHAPRVEVHGGPDGIVCGGGALLARGSASPLAVPPNALQGVPAWVACAVDAGGNTVEAGRGLVDPAWFPPPTTQPGWQEATVLLERGRPASPDAIVDISVDGGIDGPPVDVCVQVDGAKCAWLPYSVKGFVPVDTGVMRGRVTLKVTARWDAKRAVAAEGSIWIDDVAPRDGKVDVDVSDEVRVTWSGFSDAESGIAKHLVASGDVKSCAGGREVMGESTTLPAAEGKWDVIVCAVDRAGNVSKGVRASVKVK